MGFGFESGPVDDRFGNREDAVAGMGDGHGDGLGSGWEMGWRQRRHYSWVTLLSRRVGIYA